jgi:isoleucyl-tRNA synthetase
MFDPVPNQANFPNQEAEVARFWKEQAIYEKSLAARADAEPFIFYEGPPTANGMPHPGHCLTRAIKDLFPRYRTMRGYRCERKAGWDTHGLPVEVEVCKELGIHSKEEIESFGVEPFIHKCQQSVWRYMQEWERLTERLGFWIHLDEAYVTYHQSYVESVWWSLKNFFDRGLLYQGHKIVWWWAQGGTALSAGEVGQGYREVADPSVYVKFPLTEELQLKNDVMRSLPPASLLVWTTTPWTLPSNQFAAINPGLEYAVVLDVETDDLLIVASELVEVVAEKVKRPLEVQATFSGEKLLGKHYVPPFASFLEDAHTWGGLVYGINDDGDEIRKQHLAEFLANQHTPKTFDLLNWTITEASFVTTDAGSGIVHIAPAFGEDDYDLLESEIQRARSLRSKNPSDRHVYRPRLINAVAPDGKFTMAGPDYCVGRWVKDCDKDITRDLRDRGLLYHQEQYLHEYPFCWRAEEDPLIQYPRESWFVRTTKFKDRMLENNRAINWLPEHIKEGRFGNFLESNVDWALSRERYWGTPLPIWVCSETGKQEAIASYDELLAKPGVAGTEAWDEANAKNPDLPEDLKVHKPYIDEVTYDSPFAPDGRMVRVSEVIDCWFDSGAMPFAQWGYPHQGREQFAAQFPADFISEAIDQTRGWFYSQLAISTLLFGESPDGEPSDADAARPATPFPHPYRNCIVLGLMLSEWYESKDGKQVYLSEAEAKEKLGPGKYAHRVGKMSKSKRNYREPREIFDTLGADALRWYFFANQPPWTSIVYSEQAIKDSIPEFLLRLWNVYSFFVIYANIDGFDPASTLSGEPGQLRSEELGDADTFRPASERGELDRWVLSELARTCAAVTQHMDAYENYPACQRIIDFVDGLSNWYVRRSRDRFWSSDKASPDKLDAYWTLYECLLTTSKLIAPFTPFLAETFWRNLAAAPFGEKAPESVHLCDYPTGDETALDEALSARMGLVREISSLGRSARMEAKLKVRQPLAKVEVVLADQAHEAWLLEHAALIRDELNVKRVEFTADAEKYISYQVLPDFKRLGPRLGKQLPDVKKALGEADGAALLAEMKSAGQVTLPLDGGDVTLDGDDIQVRLQAKEGWAAAQGPQCVVVLATELTDELIQEGVARELVRVIQDRRKETGCEFTDRILIGLVTESETLRAAAAKFVETIRSETLAVELGFEAIEGVEPVTLKVAGEEVQLYLKVV